MKDNFKSDFKDGWNNYLNFAFRYLPKRDLGFKLTIVLLYFFGILFLIEVLFNTRIEYMTLYVLMGVSVKLSQIVILLRK